MRTKNSKSRLIAVFCIVALCVCINGIALAATKINVADYYPLTQGDTWLYTGYNAGNVYMNGTRVINGVTTLCMYWGCNGSTNYYTLDSSGLKVYGVTSIHNGQSYDTFFTTPQFLSPQYAVVGKTYVSTTSYQGYTYKSSLTVDGYENITVNGVVFKNAVKVTEIDTDIRQSDGQITVQKYDMWLVKNLGTVKEYYYENGQTRYIQSATTYYSSGLKEAQLLATPDASGYVYYEYENKNFKGTGCGRVTKRQRSDGSYNLLKYWGNTATVRNVKEYNANGVLTSCKYYNRQGKLIATYEYNSKGKNNSYLDESIKKAQVEQAVISHFSDHFVGQLASDKKDSGALNGLIKK